MSILPPHLSANERRLIEENERLHNRIEGLHKLVGEAVRKARADTWKAAIEIANAKSDEGMERRASGGYSSHLWHLDSETVKTICRELIQAFKKQQ